MSVATSNGGPAARAVFGQAVGLGVDDGRLVELARAGDEDAFATLVRRYSAALLRRARLHVPSAASAEDVVQETWIGVLRGLDRFEGRSPFQMWLFGILVNQAKTHGVRERRSVPFVALGVTDAENAPAVGGRPGAWMSVPRRWQEDPEEATRSREMRRIVQSAVDALPARQRIVITMCDLEGLHPDEVRSTLEISETHRRVLLHRARSKVRPVLQQWIDAGAASCRREGLRQQGDGR